MYTKICRIAPPSTGLKTYTVSARRWINHDPGLPKKSARTGLCRLWSHALDKDCGNIVLLAPRQSHACQQACLSAMADAISDVFGSECQQPIFLICIMFQVVRRVRFPPVFISQLPAIPPPRKGSAKTHATRLEGLSRCIYKMTHRNDNRCFLSSSIRDDAIYIQGIRLPGITNTDAVKHHSVRLSCVGSGVALFTGDVASCKNCAVLGFKDTSVHRAWPRAARDGGRRRWTE